MKIRDFIFYTPDMKQYAIVGAKGKDGKHTASPRCAEADLGDTWSVEDGEGCVEIEIEIDLPKPTKSAAIKFKAARQ